MPTRASAGTAPRSCTTKRRTLGVARSDAVIVDEVLPDRHGVAATAQRLDNPLPVWLREPRNRPVQATEPKNLLLLW